MLRKWEKEETILMCELKANLDQKPLEARAIP